MRRSPLSSSLFQPTFNLSVFPPGKRLRLYLAHVHLYTTVYDAPKCARDCATRNASAHRGASVVKGHTPIRASAIILPLSHTAEREKERNGRRTRGKAESRGGRIILCLRRRGGERESRGDEKLEAGREGGRKRGDISAIPERR